MTLQLGKKSGCFAITKSVIPKPTTPIPPPIHQNKKKCEPIKGRIFSVVCVTFNLYYSVKLTS